MSATVRRRGTCRLCGGASLSPVLSLRPTPLANAYVDDRSLDKPQQSYPLDLFRCEACGHVQLVDVVDPLALFERHRSPISAQASEVAHVARFAEELVGRFQPPAGAFVLGIGSNDGSMLKVFEEAGLRPYGVEPAVDLARIAISDGVPTFPGFFSPAVAERIEEHWGRAAIVVANSVLSHADDLKGIVDGVRILLRSGGVFAFEVCYLADIVEGCLFDAIRHEQLDYHAVGPLRGFFADNGLELLSVRRMNHGGGRLRGIVQRRDGPHAGDDSVSTLRAAERRLGLESPDSVRSLAPRMEAHGRDLAELLRSIKRDGGHIVGWGATARSTTLLHEACVDRDVIDFIVDDNAWKHGLFTPGLHLPVKPPQALDRRHADWVLVLAWDSIDEVLDRCRDFREAGGRLIAPFPEIRVV